MQAPIASDCDQLTCLADDVSPHGYDDLWLDLGGSD